MRSKIDIVPILCLVLAILMLVFGFATLALESPGESQALHRARVQGDERTSATLEQALQKKKWSRTVLTTGLFAGSVLMTVLAFALMGDQGGLSPEIVEPDSEQSD